MLVYIVLLLYFTAPILLFILTRNKIEEGRIWLVLFGIAGISWTLFLIGPVVLIQREVPALWFSSQSFIVPFTLQWGMMEWMLQLLIASAMIIFLVEQYLEKRREKIPQIQISIRFWGAALTVLGLSFGNVFSIVILFFSVDGLLILSRFLAEGEVFSKREYVFPFLLRLVSIPILAVFSIAQVRIAQYPGWISLLFIFLLLRVFAWFLEYDQRLDESDNPQSWLECVEAILMVLIFSNIASYSPTTGWIWIVLLAVLTGSMGILLFLGVFRSNKRWEYFIFILASILLALGFFLTGVRNEMTALLLSMLFLLLHDLFPGKGRIREWIMLGLEIIFLCSYSFSPFYVLNRVVINNGIPFSWTVLLFISEGVFLALFIDQRSKQIKRSRAALQEEAAIKSYLYWAEGVLLAILVLRTALPLQSLSAFSWYAILPSLGLLIVPINYAVMHVFQKGTARSQKESSAFRPVLSLSQSMIKVSLVVVNLFRQLFEAISAVLEGEGGLIWAVIFLILLLTLYKGLVAS